MLPTDRRKWPVRCRRIQFECRVGKPDVVKRRTLGAGVIVARRRTECCSESGAGVVGVVEVTFQNRVRAGGANVHHDLTSSRQAGISLRRHGTRSGSASSECVHLLPAGIHDDGRRGDSGPGEYKRSGMYDRGGDRIVDVIDVPLTVGGKNVSRHVVIHRCRNSWIVRNRCGPTACRDLRERSVEDACKLVHHAGRTVGGHVGNVMRVVDERARGSPTSEGYFCVDGSVADSGNCRRRGGGAVAGPRRELQHVKV